MPDADAVVKAKAPNPGSPEACEQGCLCPIYDNCQGRFAPFPPDGWWLREDCPLHGRDAVLRGEG